MAFTSDYPEIGDAITPDAPPGPDGQDGRAVIERRHREYRDFFLGWRWLLDSLEGGERYREADYGTESYRATWMEPAEGGERAVFRSHHHTIPRRNLIRHPQEYPTGDTFGPFGDGAPSTSDEYEFRRAMTPVPAFVGEAIAAHLARIYSREVRRVAPDGAYFDPLREWWADVDGSGTEMDDWMQESIAPLFLALGQIDLAFDHPPAPGGETVASQADLERLGLTAVVASYILPENLTDWALAPDRSYVEAVVREWCDDGDERFRRWTAEGSTLYDCRGRSLGSTPHDYGRVPIFRAFDTRKPRCDNVGQPRYEAIAEIQRTYYNVDSELTLSNSLAAHPTLSGPEKYCQGAAIQVGPGNVLPKTLAVGQGWQGWEYVCPPSDAAAKLESKLHDLRDAADRSACLTKPAGAAGTGRGTVGQSGVSKMLDQTSGNDLLSKISKALRRLELRAAEMVLTVAHGKAPDRATMGQVKVAYPTKFDLFTAADFSALMLDFQALMAGVDGELPETVGHLFKTFIALALPGLDDATYDEIDAEFAEFLSAKKAEADRRAEAGPPTLPGMIPGADGGQADGADPLPPPTLEDAASAHTPGLKPGKGGGALSALPISD